ncbi:hypothetical protein HAZT_HAZT002770 [Hyalella azteca]|uniref:Homeobox domain-containing protein n=1 Tax=Hyalella azteca TaxID=294128 RepID=A0A6A0HBW7_HYAAZ|nr:hypothetical protein HAZT_HAZT002770 [Hyalella azteca]
MLQNEFAATRNIVQPTQAPEGTSVARKRRPNLRPEAKAVLTAWLTEHRHHPYPTEEEKDALVCEAGVTLAQLNQWSVNARRRKLPKLQLEDGSPPSDTTSTTTRQRRAVGENNRNDRRARSHRVVLLEGSPGNVVQLPPPPEDTSYLLLLADLTVVLSLRCCNITGKKRRGNLNEESVGILKKWLYDHRYKA